MVGVCYSLHPQGSDFIRGEDKRRQAGKSIIDPAGLKPKMYGMHVHWLTSRTPGLNTS
jgi:hypothetical protein